MRAIHDLKRGVICGFRYPISDLIRKTIHTAHASCTDILTNWLTYWLPDKINKLTTEWINVSSMPFWFVTEVFFFKIPRLQCPNQGSHMMEFLLLSLKSVAMIAIRALTGMQLRSNEGKMLRWQTHGVFCCGSKNSSKLLFSQF